MCRLRLLIFHYYTKYDAKLLIYAKLWPKNKIQYSGHSHIEFISDGYFHTYFLLCTPYKILRLYLNPRLNYNFLKFKMAASRPPSWIFENLINDLRIALDFLCSCTKCGAKILIDARIIAKNQNSRWRPSAILKLLYHHIGPPTKTCCWATLACQIIC